MSVERAKVVVDVIGNVDQINNALKSVQNNLSKLNLPPAAEKGFNKLFSKLEAEITSFREKSESALTSQQDVNKFVKNWERIVDLYRQLGLQVKNLDALSNNQKLTLIPGDSAEKFKKITAALKTYEHQISQTNSEIKKQTAGFNEAQKKVDKYSNTLNELKSQKNILNDEEFNKFNKEAKKAEATLEALAKRLEEAKKALDNAPKTSTGKVDRRTKIGSEATKEYNLAKQAYDDQKVIADEARLKIDGKVKESKHSRDIEEYTRKLSEAKQKVDAYQQSLKKLSDVDTAQHFQKLKQELTNITGVDLNAAKSVDELRETIAQLGAEDLDAANKLLEQFQQNVNDISPGIKKMSKDVDNASESFKELVRQQNSIDQLKNRLVSFFSIGSVVQTFRRAIHAAYESVKELDAVMTQAAVVTNYDVGDMWERLPEYTDRANKLGASVKGAYETTTLFYQQGLNTEQAIQLSIETMKMARIANLDYATATDYMTAALRGFNMELNEASATRVNDVYSKLAAITASDTREISIAMTKTASIANSANMELETTAALLSQIIETTREAPETAGTAMKTIIARFQELKKAPSEIGEVDGEIVDANKIEGALRTIGVALRDANGQFRDLDDVFLDIAKKWDSLDTNTQRYIATMAAGSRQQSRFIAMMSDYERTMELVNAANNSAGASQKQFEKTLDSLDAKLSRLKNSWDTFVQGLANSSFIKASVDALAFLLNVLNKITDILGANGISDFAITLTLILGIFSKLKTVVGNLLEEYQSFKKVIEKGKVIETATQTATTAGSTTGFEAGATAAIPGMTAAVAEATEKGVMSGLGAVYAQMKGYKGLPAPSTNTIPIDDEGPLLLPGHVETHKGFKERFRELKDKFGSKFDGLGNKFGNFIDTKFGGSMKKFGLALAGAAVATSAVTKGLTWLLDKGITTAGEKLEEIGQLKDLAQTSLNNIDEKINSIDSAKESYEYNRDIASVTYRNDKNHIQAVKSNNELIRTIRSEFPKLAKYTEYQDGQWEVETSFWKEYELALEQQRDSLDSLTNALQAEEEELTYEQSLSEGINTTSISDDEQEVILDATEIGAGLLGTVGAIVALSTLALGPLAMIGATAGIAAGGAAAGGLLGATGASIWAQRGISEEQFGYQANVLSDYGDLDEETASKLESFYQGDIKKKDLNDEEKELVDNLGGAEAFHELYSAVDGNVDVLNEQVYQYQNLKSAQEEFRLATLKAAGALGDDPEVNEKIISYSEIGLSKRERDKVYNQAERDWSDLSEKEKNKHTKDAMKAAGASYNKVNETWSLNGEVLDEDKIEEYSLKYYQNEQWNKYAKDFAEGVKNGEYEEIGELQQAVANLTNKQLKDLENGDYSVLGSQFNNSFGNYVNTTGGGNAFGASDDALIVGDVVYNKDFEAAVAAAIQSNYVKDYRKIKGDEELKELVDETGQLDLALSFKKMGMDENEVGKQLYDLYTSNQTSEEQKKVIEQAFKNPIKSLDDLQSTMAQLEEAGITLDASTSELIDKFNIKDLGSTVTSETITTISDKLTSGSALSIEEASQISEAMGHGTITDDMSAEELSAAGFVKTDDGYILSGITAAEAIQALNAKMALDVGAMRQILENEHGEYGMTEEDTKESGIFDAKNFEDMDYNHAMAAISSAGAAQRGEITSATDPRLYGKGIIAGEDVIHFIKPSQEEIDATNTYLDTQLALTGAIARYNAEKAKLDKTDAKSLLELKKKIVAEEQYKQKLTNLSKVVGELSDELNSSDLTKYHDALDKIAAAASSELGLDLTQEQVADLKNEFIALSQGGEGARQALAEIAKTAASNTQPLLEFGVDAEKAEELAAKISEKTYEMYATGDADFSGIITELLAVTDSAEDAQTILQKMAGSGIEFKIAEKTITMPDGTVITLPGIVAKYVGGDATKNFTPYKGRGGGGGSSKTYENKYDKRYNLVQDIAEEQRTLNRLQDQYNDLLLSANVSAEKLSKNYQDQIASLKKTEKLNQQLLDYRKKDFKEYLNENSKYSQYATYNWKDNTIEIDWDKINAIKDEELGSNVDEYISKLEEFEGYMDDTNDTLMEINNQVAELAQAQQEAYITGLNSIKDAIVEVRQKEIDKLSSLNETINDSNSRMFEAIQKAIDDERRARENDKTEEDIANKEKRLAQLQMDTSGGNQLEILQLQKEIDEAREGYQDSLVDQQLSRMQEDANAAAEQRERQISLLEEQLEIDQLNGEIWNQVFDIWNTGFTSNGKLDWGSPLGQLLREIADYQSMSDAERIQYTTDKGNEMALAKAGEALGYSNQIDYSQEIAAAKAGTISSQTGIDYGKLDEEELAQRKKILEQLRNQKIDSTGSNAKKTYEFNEDPNKNKQSAPEEEKQQPSKGSGYISSMTSQIGHKTGSTDQVKKFQEGYNELISDGLISGTKLNVDGSDGPKTTAAIKQLQELIGVNADGYWGKNSRNAFKNSKFKAYKTGGLADFTGPAWLDGTKSHPELVLNARDTENFIQLKDILSNVLKRDSNKAENSGDNYFEIHIDVERIEDDYDVEQLADKIKGIIQQDAMYRNVNFINHLR